MSTHDLQGRRSTLLQRYGPKTVSQDPLNQPMMDSNEGIRKSPSQRSLQNSALLQRHYSKASPNYAQTDTNSASNFPEPKKLSSSVRSLDQSKLLQRYYKQNSQESQDVPKTEPQQYSSQKNLESSKLLQRYNPVNNSQEFTGLAVRESTPVARFTRSGSLDQERPMRQSLLSRYTPRFGQSLDRNKTAALSGGSYSNYSSQQSLDQQEPHAQPSLSQSQTIADYGSDHFDQYTDTRNLRSRSSSMARGLSRRSAQRELEPPTNKLDLEKENIPIEPISVDTLPVIATTEPVMGNIASALLLPVLGLIPATPVVETNQPSLEPMQSNKALLTAPTVSTQPQLSQPITPLEPEKPKRKEPVKPPRKDLAASVTVSTIPSPTTITAPIVTVDPPKLIRPTAIATKKEATFVVPKDPTPPPMFSNRDRMEHYGSASITSPTSSNSPTHQQHSPPSSQIKNTSLLAPISDLSSRRSITDLRSQPREELASYAMEIDEASERQDLRVFSQKKEAVKSTLASAFEQIAVLAVPQAQHVINDEENIEALPPDRKLKKRDHTYHPSFVPKQAKMEEDERKKQEEKARQEAQKKENQERKKEDQERRKEDQERKKEEERLKKEEDKLRKESEKNRKEDEKRKREEDKRLKVEDDKRKKDEEKLAREEEKRLREEDKRNKDLEKKKMKEEKKKAGLKKSLSADQEVPVQLEEETIDFGSHLEQYSVSGPATQARSVSVGRPRSSGTPRGSQGALNRHTLPAMSGPMYSSQQSLDRSGGVQSKMLQRYAKRSGSQDFTHSGDLKQFAKEVHRSQGSLEQRMPRSTLLQRYAPRPLSASTAGQAPAPPSTPRTTSQISLEKTRIEKSSLLQRYKAKEDQTAAIVDQPEQHKATVVFKPKIAPGKHPTFDYRDHEYEPIGEPVDSKQPEIKPSSLALPSSDQQRKLSSASLRVPGDDADTISMNELQKDIEDRYFNRPAEEDLGDAVEITATESSQEKTSKMKAAMNRAHESGKKAMARAQESSKNAMAKAQEGSKSLHQKLRKQTDKFKTKMSSINVGKKDKDTAPLASPEIVTTPEIEKLDFTLQEPKAELETGEIESVAVTTAELPVEEIDDAAVEQGATRKKFKTPEFSKLKNIHMPKLQKPDFKIAKPKMPKLKAPDMSKFKRPEMPKFLTEKPDFSKLKMPEKIGTIKLQRSKSLKEPSDSAIATSPSDAETPSVVGAEDSKKKLNYTDFSTYPRLLDKFKRQKSTPGSNASVRASTPPPLEFTKAGKTSRPKGSAFISRWAEKSSEDTGSNRFFSGSELGEREGSVEKRMRQRLERADFDAPELPVTAEQKQLEEYDKENREIHLLSAARHDEFIKRKPPMERQESDLASEEEKQFWASSLGQKIRQNIDMNSNDFDFLDEDEQLRAARENESVALSARDRARFLGETVEQLEKDYDMRSTTPYSNKECQSSRGSSVVRRRKGVLEEIDDDEFFLRQKGISKDNIQMGEYISSAIKEGLSTPVNALAEMGRYDSYDQDMDASERMSMDFRGEHGATGLRYYQPSFESDDLSTRQSITDEFRKNAEFFKTFPPDRPARKQKKSFHEEHHDEEGSQQVPYDSYQQEEAEGVEFYDRDRKYIDSEQPYAEEERYIDDESSIGNGFSRTGTVVPPTPPRRRKKRFRDVTPSELEPFGNGLTSKPIYNSFTIGPETHIFNAEVPLAQEESFTTPLPTPRISRSRSQISKAFEDDHTSRGAESYIFGAVDNAMVKHTSVDLSESNGYAIVRKEPPPRPPAPMRRRRSTRSLGDHHKFNTLPNFHSVSPVRPTRNYSTINPNRPPRIKSNTNLADNKIVSKDDITQYEDIEHVENQVRPHQTSLQSGPVVSRMKDRPLPPPPRPPREHHRKPRLPEPDDDHHDFGGGAERILTVEQQPSFERVEEVEIAIQTDPLPEDYELDFEVSETIGAAERAFAPAKTLQEILKEEQQAEIDRARQLAEASNLMRDIQKFRESTSSLSLQGSRPETPAAGILLERRLSTPSGARSGRDIRPLSNENLSEQDLAHVDDDKYIAELVKKYVSEEKVPVSENGTKRQLKTVPVPSEIDTERLEELESMIVSEQMPREEIRAVRSEPPAPPRRRSLFGSNQDLPISVEIPPNVIEEIVERLRTNEQQHIVELNQLHQHQLEELRTQQEEQKRLQEQKLEEQQKQLLDQQTHQLHETQQLKEQILQQQEQQKTLLAQQQQQQQQLLLAQQQQQIMLQQQEKERELQRERERELLREREIELEKARDRAHELEQQRAKELEQQRLREHELQRAMEQEHQRLRELELQRVQEVELQRIREMEIQRAREAELQRLRDIEMQRIREIELEMQRAKEVEMLRAKESEAQKAKEEDKKEPEQSSTVIGEQHTAETISIVADESEPIVVEQTPAKTAHDIHTTQEPTPARPPPPRISPQIPLITPQQYPYQEFMPYAVGSQHFYPMTRNLSDDEVGGGAIPQAPHRRRRHHRSRRDSTSEEEFQRDQQRRQRHGTRSPEPSIPALGSQLIRACGSSIRETGDELMTILRASSKDENKRDLHIALIILIVIVAGLMALGMSAEKAVHHHHWDYFNPPSSGRA